MTTMKRTVFVILSSAFIFVLYYIVRQPHFGYYDIPAEDLTAPAWVVNTSGCRIPKLNPFDFSIQRLIKRLPPLKCEDNDPLVIVDGRTIRINTLSKHYIPNHMNCTYGYIRRVNDTRSAVFDRQELVGVVNVTSEFVAVECKNSKTGKVVHDDYFAFIFEKPEVEKRAKAALPEREKYEKLRILCLGLDSVSKNQYLRHMLKTDNFIRNNLTFVELHGYNKVGKNTFMNMVPFLSGKLATELNDSSNVEADVYPLVWKEFAEHGYRTLFSEDSPDGAIFNYARIGFKEPPVHYYLRPYSTVVEKSLMMKNSKAGCFHGQLETSTIIKWTEDLYDKFSTGLLFTFTFLSRLSHDYINQLSYLDEPIHDFLQRMLTKGHLNNTIIFLFGDHGFRFGEIRSTYVGRMEGRLPTMFILLPPWLPQKYPQLYANLKVNERRLTTPLDIYATLKDILYLKEDGVDQEGSGRGISLMRYQVPENRTCKDSQIESQWCSCVERDPVPVNDYKVIAAAEKSVEKINAMTNTRRKECAEVKLVSVLSASTHDLGMGEDDKSDRSVNYLVTYKVKPSEGVFEGSVWYNHQTGRFTADSTIERVNRYNNQSACINVASMKPFCYCL